MFVVEWNGCSRMKKKWIYILLTSSLIITLVAVFMVITVQKKNNGKIETPKEDIKVISEVIRETGSEIPTLKDFGIEEEGKIEFFIQEEKVENIDNTKVNTYDVKITVGEKEYTSILKFVDTVAPDVSLKEVSIEEGNSYLIENFIESCKDISSACHYSYESEEMGSYQTVGTYKIVILTEDDSKNISKKETTLSIQAKKQEETPSTSVENNKPTPNPAPSTSQSGSSPNNTSKPNSTPTPTPPAKTFVEKKDEVTTKVEKKYGTTITYTTTTTYNYYSDNSKEKVGEKTTTNIDYSTFNATTAEMKPEAKTLYQQNVNELKEVLKYVNQYRSEVSVSPLVFDETLSILATVRAIEMGWSNNFSHTRPNGESCFQILEEEGIKPGAAGENIAFGYANAAAVSEGWKQSQGHYENMISTYFGHIGIGKAVVNGKIYWVQIFTD